MGLLGKILRGAGSLRDGKGWTKPRIDSFETHAQIAGVSFIWDEIDAVRANKIDLITTDEIRVLVSFGRLKKVLELSEEQDGFDAFIRIAERKLSFPEGWRERLVKPAFETCETTLFSR